MDNEQSAETPTRSRLRREHVIALGLGFLALTFALSFYDEELSDWGDNAQFVVVAKSIATGAGFREINDPARPVHRKYPIGFPLTLAPFELVKPNAFSAMKVFVLCLFVITTVLIYFLLLPWSGRWTAAATAALFATNRLSLIFAHQIMSEIPYLCLSMLALLLYFKAERARGSPGERWWIAGMIVACLWALLLRSVGLALVAALCGRLALDRRWWGAASLAVGSVGTILIHSLVRGSGHNIYMRAYILVDWYDVERGYVTLGGLLARMIANGEQYLLRLIPGSIAPADAYTPLLLLIALIVAIGLVRHLVRLHPAALYYVLMIAILLAWPRKWAVYRYVLPLLPLSLFFFIRGISTVAELLARRFHRVPAAAKWGAVACLVGGLAVVNLVDVMQYRPRADLRWQSYFQALRWLRANTKPAAVVMCRKPYLGFLLSQRRTVGVPRSTSKAAFYQRLGDAGVDYVVVDSLRLPGTRQVVVPRIRQEQRQYTLIYRSPTVWIYKVRRPAPPG